jgi:hypothetical protein
LRQIRLKLHHVLVNIVQDLLVERLLLLRQRWSELLNAMLTFILVGNIIQKVFDVLVLHYLLLEEILPHFVKLQLASLYLAIY